jgi:hypothetical protein
VPISFLLSVSPLFGVCISFACTGLLGSTGTITLRSTGVLVTLDGGGPDGFTGVLVGVSFIVAHENGTVNTLREGFRKDELGSHFWVSRKTPWFI